MPACAGEVTARSPPQDPTEFLVETPVRRGGPQSCSQAKLAKRTDRLAAIHQRVDERTRDLPF